MTKYIVSGVGSVLITAFTLVAMSISLPSHAAEPERIASAAKPATANAPGVERGRYLVKLGGCNDCHTPGYNQAGGNLDERNWLIGDSLGWQGPWGTTFPINLRLYVNSLTEDQWVVATRNSKARPPMPVWVFRDLSEQDLRSVYRFIRSLGAAGTAAPAYVPPGGPTSGPVVKFPS